MTSPAWSKFILIFSTDLNVKNKYDYLGIGIYSVANQFTLVNYDSRVVIWGIFQSGTTLEL